VLHCKKFGGGLGLKFHGTIPRAKGGGGQRYNPRLNIVLGGRKTGGIEGKGGGVVSTGQSGSFLQERKGSSGEKQYGKRLLGGCRQREMLLKVQRIGGTDKGGENFSGLDPRGGERARAKGQKRG